MEYKIKFESHFTPRQTEFLNRCVFYSNKVLASQDFKYQILAANFKHTKDMSAKEIYQMIVSGRDSSSAFEDEVLNVSLSLFHGNRKTVAKTVMGTARVMLNTFHLGANMSARFGEAVTAGTLFHEYVHVMGFKHPWFPPGWYTQSVPYVCGRIMNKLVLKSMKGELQLTPWCERSKK